MPVPKDQLGHWRADLLFLEGHRLAEDGTPIKGAPSWHRDAEYFADVSWGLPDHVAYDLALDDGNRKRLFWRRKRERAEAITERGAPSRFAAIAALAAVALKTGRRRTGGRRRPQSAAWSMLEPRLRPRQRRSKSRGPTLTPTKPSPSSRRSFTPIGQRPRLTALWAARIRKLGSMGLAFESQVVATQKAALAPTAGRDSFNDQRLKATPQLCVPKRQV